MAESIVAESDAVRPTTEFQVSPDDGSGLREASRKTYWVLTGSAPGTVDQLSFTSRDDLGRINWWDVKPPKTNYWHVHETLGRAYAYEVLDLLNNPNADGDNDRALGFVMGAIARWLPTTAGTAASGMADGFFRVISEYVATGTASR